MKFSMKGMGSEIKKGYGILLIAVCINKSEEVVVGNNVGSVGDG